MVDDDEFWVVVRTSIEATARWIDCPCDAHATDAEGAAIAALYEEVLSQARWINTRMSAYCLGPSRPRPAVAGPQHGSAIAHAQLAIKDRPLLRSHLEAKLLAWIGIQSTK